LVNEDGILSVLSALGCGALILDEKGRVLRTNDRARRYLGSVLDVSRRGATPTNGGDNERIQIALREALRASTRVLPQLGPYITVPRRSSRPLLLRSIVLAPGGDGQGGASAALIVLDMEDAPQPDDELLRDLFLLTPAEIRLARHLSRGENLSDIAEAIGVAIGTLRVQLKMLFIKTGTRRQGELIALLAHLSRLSA
jgi:DNA-binding CsgD family transcriptional regulator